MNGCAISADGGTVVSASDDRTLKIWRRKDAALLDTVSGPTTFLCVDLVGDLVVAGDGRGNVWILDGLEALATGGKTG